MIALLTDATFDVCSLLRSHRGSHLRHKRSEDRQLLLGSLPSFLDEVVKATKVGPILVAYFRVDDQVGVAKVEIIQSFARDRFNAQDRVEPL